MSPVSYVRVWTRDKDPGSQVHALIAAVAVRVFGDHGSQARIRDRPQWLVCLDNLRPGDTLNFMGPGDAEKKIRRQ